MRRRDKEEALIRAAVRARKQAYAPYSGFRVGAAVRLRDGRVAAGANVENSSYGLTVCAERNAVAAAVLKGARRGDLVALAIATDTDQPTTPCGACRQVLREFMPPTGLVLLYGVASGRELRLSLAKLLPRAFGPEQLSRT